MWFGFVSLSVRNTSCISIDLISITTNMIQLSRSIAFGPVSAVDGATALVSWLMIYMCDHFGTKSCRVLSERFSLHMEQREKKPIHQFAYESPLTRLHSVQNSGVPFPHVAVERLGFYQRSLCYGTLLVRTKPFASLSEMVNEWTTKNHFVWSFHFQQ